MGVWTSMKKTKIARWLINRGWGFHGIQGRVEHRRKIKSKMKSSSIGKDRVLTLTDGTKMWIPEFKNDVVQSYIFMNDDFWERDNLKLIQKTIESARVILDIGANIGNHSLYFAKYLNAEKVFSYEPVKSTWKILKRNIELNNLENVIMPINAGVGEDEYRASVDQMISRNRGGTSIRQSESGDMEVRTIDSENYDIVDLMKIDTEGYELKVLKGAVGTIKRCKPIIFIEISPENLEAISNMMDEWQYECIFHGYMDYIWKAK